MKLILTIDNEDSTTVLYHFIRREESAWEQLSMWSFVSIKPAEFLSFKCSAVQCISEKELFKTVDGSSLQKKWTEENVYKKDIDLYIWSLPRTCLLFFFVCFSHFLENIAYFKKFLQDDTFFFFFTHLCLRFLLDIQNNSKVLQVSVS